MTLKMQRVAAVPLILAVVACAFRHQGSRKYLNRREAATSSDLEPFNIVLTVLNKREIMDKMATSWFGWAADYIVSDQAFTEKITGKLETMLPPQLQEMGIDCKLDTIKTEGLTATMVMDIRSYSMGTAMAKAKGAVFAEALESLFTILANLGMGEKAHDIEDKVGEKLRAGLMTKIPEILEEKLAEENVKVSVTTDPLPPPADPPPQKAPEPVYNLFYRIVIRDRETLLQSIDKPAVKKIVRNLPQATFLKSIQNKLLEKVSAGVKEKMGTSLDLTVNTVEDLDAGAANKESFWLLVQVNSIDVSGLLRNTKGSDFADNFTKLMGVLQQLAQLGLDNMDITINNLQTQIDNQALGGLGESLPAMLEKSLGAEVSNVSMSVYDSLQKLAPAGRCCYGGENYWWVADNLARGAGMFGRGFGKKGHCPKVMTHEVSVGAEVVTEGCAARGKAVGKAHHTEYRPYTDCFSFGTEFEAVEAVLTAYPVSVPC